MTSPAPRRSRGGGGRPREAARIRSRSELLGAGVFLASVLTVTMVFVFTTVMVRRLSEQVVATSELLARFCAQASFPAARDPELQRILADVITGIDFPIVITDEDAVPRAWRLVGLDPVLVPDASLDSLAAGLAIAPAIQARVDRLRARIARLDEAHEPIAMSQPQTGAPLGRLHYGDPPLIERLRWMPYLTVSGLLILIALGMWGHMAIRRGERRTIWVGMALETAHQLGTPLSSLLGWIELLRSRMDGPDVREHTEPGVSRAELVETLDEMERDVERLTKVAQRFSHVGSAPRLEVQDVTAIVQGAVEYMRRRVPGGDGEVTIVERYAHVPPLPCNRELLAWAIENLIANAVSALDKRPGRIEIATEPRESGGVEILVSDNGRGMTPVEQRRAFEPGYTTKPRGWGLGLALSRRVVEDYHRGKLSVRHSVPGEGTTLVIALPK